jgi:hypothetical protein
MIDDSGARRFSVAAPASVLGLEPSINRSSCSQGHRVMASVDMVRPNISLAWDALELPNFNYQLQTAGGKAVTSLGTPNHSFVASRSGETAGASSKRGFTNPASLSQPPISSKLNVSPASVFTSMLTANNNPTGGPLRSSLTMNSMMAIIPPDASALKVFFSNFRLRSRPSLCRIWPSVATLWPLPKSASNKSPGIFFLLAGDFVPLRDFFSHVEHLRPIHC